MKICKFASRANPQAVTFREGQMVILPDPYNPSNTMIGEIEEIRDGSVLIIGLEGIGRDLSFAELEKILQNQTR